MRDQHKHRRHCPLSDEDPPPLVYLDRRQLIVGIGLLPLAGMTLSAHDAWALANQVSIETDGNFRVIKANAIPDHPTGQFPNAHNPNAISAQNLSFKAPLKPTRSGAFRTVQGWNFGVAVNGVPFDPFTGEFWNNDRRWNYDAISGYVDLGLDQNGAHVQPGGKYHYHGWPKGLIKSWSPSRHSPIIGWAADGFPIYAAYGFADPKKSTSPVKKMTSGWRVKQGQRSGGPGGKYDGRFFADWEWSGSADDLDQANGRDTATPEYPGGTYAYFLTEDWPVIPRYFAGEPDQSFKVGPPGGGQGGSPGGPRSGRPPGGRGPGPGGRPPPPWGRQPRPPGG